MTHEAVDMKDFNEWWDRDIIRSSPFRRGSPKYWAWAAWEAAIKAEREACAMECLKKANAWTRLGAWGSNNEFHECAEAIRARG